MTIKCEFCNGLGKDEDANDCAWCWGTGSKAAQKRMAPPDEAATPDRVTTAQPAGQAQRHTIAHLRYAGGEEHNVKYVSEVDYDRVVAEVNRKEALIVSLLGQVKIACGQRDTLQARLAEREALLREVPAMPSTVDRRPNDEDQPDGYLEGDRSWCDNNKNAVEWLIENHAAIRAALSASAEPAKKQLVECDACPRSGGCVDVCMKAPASAEPSAPKCETCSDHGAVGNILNAEPCPDCSYSAPVEIDERAEFEAWFKDHSKDWPFPSESIKCIARDNDWLVWQARAALERKQ